MVKIIADSTCDLSQELIEKYDISIIPLHIVLGEKEYKDGSEISPDDIYQWSDDNKTTPKTSASSIDDTMDVLKNVLDAGNEAVMFSISEKMSTTGNIFRMAAEELEAEEKVSVIDSANLSTGIGLLVIEAAIMAKEGKTKEEITAAMEQLKPLVRASFVVDTLVYLHRGGRCSSVAAMAGGILKLHPKIVVEDGAMEATKKYRGKMDSVIMNYVKDMEEDLKKARTKRVFITHSGCGQEIVDQVSAYLKSLEHFDEIIVTRAGGVISSHCGPGTLGVLYIGQ
ncbi:MAG: DegV family protein [Thermoflexaceae bacterium]|nr:DegV family protein [Thermoflexaceae bacterium]